jgi:hypothetical protein
MPGCCGREETGRYILGTADPQLSNRRIGEGLEFLQALRQLVENGQSAPYEGTAVGSRFDAIPAAIEEAKPQFVLHFGDRPRNCRLRNRKFSRGFRHAAPRRHDKQDMQVAELETAPSQLDGLHLGAYQNGYGILRQ